MSEQIVEAILSRAMSDTKFADSLFAHPEQALAGYHLTTEETTALKGITQADVDAFAKASPEERKSFATVNHNETVLYLR
jgi:hypothetical protein